MGISSKQIGWSTESGLLYDIIKELDRLIKITSVSMAGAVTSVFGRTGDVIAQSGDYNTLLVTENTNLYYTNARGIGSTLTGYVSGAGTITAADTILSAIQKLNGNIAGLSSTYWALGGNTVGVNQTLGTNDPYSFSIKTNGSNRLLFQSNGEIVGQSGIRTSWGGSVVANVSHYYYPTAVTDISVFRVDGSTLTTTTNGTFASIGPTSSNSAGFSLTGSNSEGCVVGVVQGTDRLAFNARLATKTSHGLLITQDTAAGEITNYDGYMAYLRYDATTMTGSTSKSMMTIVKRGTLNGFDHTGSFLEAINSLGATGNFLKYGDGTNTLFQVDYTGKTTVQLLDSSTNTVLYANRLARYSSGTPATGIGVGTEFEVETTVGNNEIGAVVEVSATDITAASEDFKYTLKLMTAGAAASEKLSVFSEGYIFIPDASTIPSANPVGGSYLYVESGAIKARGSSGTITVIAPA